VPPIVIYGYSDQGSGASVGGNGYANDPYYFSEENPGPYQGQLMFWSTETGQTIQNLGFGGTYYSLTITSMDYWGYVIPLDANGYRTNSYYYIDSTPITFSYMPGNSRGFVIGHQGDTPYTVNGSFYLSP